MCLCGFKPRVGVLILVLMCVVWCLCVLDVGYSWCMVFMCCSVALVVGVCWLWVVCGVWFLTSWCVDLHILVWVCGMFVCGSTHKKLYIDACRVEHYQNICFAIKLVQGMPPAMKPAQHLTLCIVKF